jgi:hypothetical protein
LNAERDDGNDKAAVVAEDRVVSNSPAARRHLAVRQSLAGAAARLMSRSVWR